MKTMLALVTFVTLLCLQSSPVEASPGAQCANDSWCGIGELCIKPNSWSVMGHCIRGSR